MPLPFEFEGKGVVLGSQQEAEFVVPYANPLVHFENLKKRKYINEPTSVLDNITTSPSPPTSTSTLFSGAGGGGDTAGAAALSSQWPQPENQETSISNAGVVQLHQFQPPAIEIAGGNGDWETTESGQDQAMLRWIMGDVEDPSLGLNKVLNPGAGGGPPDFDFNGGFGVMDPVSQIGSFSQIPFKFTNDKSGLSATPHQAPAPPSTAAPIFNNPIFSPLNEPQIIPFDIKPNLFNPQLLINHSQSQIPKNPFLDSGQNPLQFLQKPSSMKKMAAIDEHTMANHHTHQQGIIDQLFKAADLIQTGNNPILAQGILARLNHQLSPIGKPFDRAAFYFKEALQLLIHSILNNINPQMNPNGSPFSLIFKIGAYKSFSEISPFVQFANFTCNQALLESLNGFDQIHIIDFDIGYGGQWASLMQELALRNNGVSSLKITAFASPSTHDQLELGLTRENLIHFANEINVRFDFEIVNIDVLASSSWSLPFHVSDTEAIAVNLPINVFSNHQTQIPSVLRFIKNLSPKIVVSVDRGSDRTDLPFSNHLIHALQSYSNLLESLDAVNMNLDVLQKIERFLIQPSIEKIVLGRYLFPEKTQHWRNLFLSAGFTPLLFSNFTESQAECLVKRTPVREFHVEKRQSSLVLCWQRRELVSASAWRC